MVLKKLLAICLVSTTLLTGCASKNVTEESELTNSEVSQEETKFTGKKTIERLYDSTGKKGDVVVVEMEFKDGKPVDVSIDVRQEDGAMKKKASEEGKYVMKEGEEKAWHEQMVLLEDFLKENNFDVSTVTISNDKGNTDAITGVSIKIASYLDAVDELIEAGKENKEIETGFTGAKIEEHPYDETGKKKDVVVTKVVFDKNKPISVSIDVKQEDGTMKKKLSQEGKYVMKEGEEKAWHEQMELLETFIKENNFDISKVTLSNDDGNTDAVTGVSIKVGPYLTGVQKAVESVK